jgi:hypothetical protein
MANLQIKGIDDDLFKGIKKPGTSIDRSIRFLG